MAVNLNNPNIQDDADNARIAANELNESLKEVAKTLKQVAEVKAFGSLNEHLASLGKVLKNYKEAEEKQKQLTTEIQQQASTLSTLGTNEAQLVTQIQNQTQARRKLGEETNKIAEYQAALRKAEIEGDQNKVNNAETALNRQMSQVQQLEQQVSLYNDLFDENSAIYQNLNSQTREKLQQLAIDIQENEIYKDHLKNHKQQYQIIQQLLGEDEQRHAIALANNKLAEEQVEAILKISYIAKTLNKTKSFFVDLLGFEKLSLLNIIKGSFELNKIYTDSAKQLGISASNTREIASAYTTMAPTANTVAAAGNNLLQTRKNELEAIGQINSVLGTAANLSKERVQDQVTLVKNMGLEADAATKIQFLSLVSGETNKEILDAVNNQVISLGKQTGIYLDNRKVLSDVAKTEGQLAAQYQNNPELLAKAVIQVKQLGIELSQAANMSNKLLNFQSSIQSELEAELLIGKALNFERARELALRGDSAAAAKEMLDQVGGLTEFQNLNVIQQRSLAESMGMSADELANSLKTQDLLLKTGDKSIDALNERRRLAIETGKTEEFYAELKRAGTSEEMIANQMQLGNQDKMNILVDKMLETFSNMVEPLTNIVGSFSNLVSSAGAFKALAVTIASLWGARIAFSIASTVTSLRQANAALVIQRGIQNVLLEKKKQEAVVAGATAAFSTGPGFPFAIAAVGAILAGLGIASSLGAFSSGGESINNPSAGASFNKSNNVSNPQNDRPIEFTVNLGGNTLAKVNTSNNKSQNTQMA
jgi:hypothetical protein